MRSPYFVRIASLARLVAMVAAVSILVHGAASAADNPNLAPGFAALPPGAKIAVMPTDIELFSISAGGVLEPKADWTEAASKHFRTALLARKATLGVQAVELNESDADEFAEVNALHAAIARSIALHHFGPGVFKLPTKDGKLDWSMGETVRAVKSKTGADYALFSWIRDSYASAERVATMVMMALLGVGVPGGAQTGYASLVDLNTGRVVWFNRLARASGDLREPDKAAETLDRLLDQFPNAR